MTRAWCSGNGVSLHYALAGTGRCTLVFIHELGGTLDSWDNVAAQFAGSYQCLCYDQRGAGASEKPRQAFTVANQVEDLHALVAATGVTGPLVLVTLAAGATVALAFVQRYPGHAAALVLCAPATGVDAARRAYLENRSMLALTHGMAAVADVSLARSYPLAAMKDVAAYQHYRGRFLANDPVGYAYANRALAQFRIEDHLAGTALPCLLLAGTHDMLRPPADVEQLAQRFSRGTLVEIDAGHLMPVQNPAAVAAQIAAFLEKMDEY